MMPFLAEVGQNRLVDMLIPIIVVSLSMLIPIVAIITDFFQKRERLRLIATALEHGVNPDDLDLGDADEKNKLRLPFRDGMITLAVGLALLLGNHYIGHNLGELRYILLVGGLVTGCVGAALLLNDWMNRKRFDQDES